MMIGNLRNSLPLDGDGLGKVHFLTALGRGDNDT